VSRYTVIGQAIDLIQLNSSVYNHWPDNREFITRTVELWNRWIRLSCYYTCSSILYRIGLCNVFGSIWSMFSYNRLTSASFTFVLNISPNELLKRTHIYWQETLPHNNVHRHIHLR